MIEADRATDHIGNTGPFQALGHEFQDLELLTHDTGLRLSIGRGLAYTIILLLACELLPGMYHQLVFLMGAI